MEKEWTYNIIYLPSQKSEEKKKERISKEIFKMETIVNNKKYMDKVTQSASKHDKSSFSEEIPKCEDEDSLGVVRKGEIICSLDEFKKSRKENKMLKEQLEAALKLIKLWRSV